MKFLLYADLLSVDNKRGKKRTNKGSDKYRKDEGRKREKGEDTREGKGGKEVKYKRRKQLK